MTTKASSSDWPRLFSWIESRRPRITALWNSAFSLFPDSELESDVVQLGIDKDLFQNLIDLFQRLVEFFVVEERGQQLSVVRVSLTLVLACSPLIRNALKSIFKSPDFSCCTAFS